MEDDHKTKKQLINELTELRSQNAALKKSESPEKYRSLVENLRDVIYELDSQGVVLYISPTIRDLLGYDSAEIVGKNIIELAHKDDLNSQAEWFSELRKGLESPSEYRIIDKSGEYKWAQTRVRPIIEGGQFKGARGILIDITEQKRAEKILRESEEKYRNVFENSIMGISQTLRDGRLIAVNNAYAKMYGYANADEMMSEVSSVGPLYANPEEREDVLRILAEKGVMEPREITVIRREGTRFTVLVGTREIRGFKGNLLYYQAEQIDITERKQAVDALRESEELFRSYLEYAPDGVYMIDLEGNFLYGNRKCEEIIGYRREELIGKNFLELNILPEQSLNKAAQLLQANIEGRSTGPDEIELISKEGRIIPVEISTSLVQRMGQRIVLAFVRDIKDRKRMEEALRLSDEKYRWMLDNMADVITVMDMNLRFTYVSPSIIRMRGYTSEEATAQTFEQVMTPESLQISAKVFEEEMKLEASGTADPDRIRIVEVEQYRKDGSIILMENHLSFMRDKAKKPVGIISVSHDITDRKRAEEEIIEQRNLSNKYLQVAGVMICALNSMGEITLINKRGLDILGYKDEQELLGKNWFEVSLPKDVAPDVKNVFNQLMSNNIDSVEYNENRILTKYGEERIVAFHNTVLRDKEDKISGVLFSGEDITARKQAEEALKKSEEEFHSLAESMPQIVWVTRKDGWNIYFNRQWVDYTGLTLEESYGHGWNTPFHPDDQQRAWSAWEKATKNHGIYSLECRLRRADGAYHWWLVRGVPLLDKAGEIIKWFGTCTDIDGIKNAEKQLQDTLDHLRRAVNTTIQVLVSAVEVRDPYTSGHQTRSADLSRAIATEMRLPQEKIDAIRMAGSIHDIGKLSIPAEILSKPTKLSEIEFALIKEHAHKGFELLKDVESPWPLAEIVYQHHERMDGSGYPRNLKGEDICMEARILAVADVVEAMASHRPYRPGLGIDAALKEIEKNKGIIYDDAVADACLRLFREKGFKLAVS